MPKKIYINKYRKLQNIDFTFNSEVNLISGTNGTCKTSILYIISNSYQRVIKKGLNLELQNCITVIQEINNMFNPKIETLTRGDKQFNDPAQNQTGTILSVEYFDDNSLDFRKHNSGTTDRFSIKPKYARNSNEKLPQIPVIYLGLSRLVSFGEFQDTNIEDIILSLKDKIGDDSLNIVNNVLKSKLHVNQVTRIKRNFPDSYINEINSIYYDFTGVKVKDSKFDKVSNLKNRADFTSNIEGIDSNTISAGEDNLYMIITALVSLKYYYESLNSTDGDGDIQSIFLIDEVDATLHPSYQIKLFNLLKQFCKDYKIQFVGTTHSLSLLEYALSKNDNVIYLIDANDYISKLDTNLDFLTIKMFLNELTSLQMNSTKKIPVFTEDEEARILIQKLFDFYYETKNPTFSRVINYFHFIKANIGSEILTNIFSDSVFIKDVTKAICILDGDKRTDLNKNIITLPGKKNPEQLLIDYLIEVYHQPQYREFWDPRNYLVGTLGYQKKVVLSNIIKEHEEIENDIASKKSKGVPTKGIRREKYKELFNTHKAFFEGLFKYWLNDVNNKNEIEKFYQELNILFKKTAIAYGINPNIWEVKVQIEEKPKVGV